MNPVLQHRNISIMNFQLKILRKILEPGGAEGAGVSNARAKLRFPQRRRSHHGVRLPSPTYGLQLLALVNSHHDRQENSNLQQRTISKTPSFNTLINWNISKVLKGNPGIDLKAALQEAQERLEDAHYGKDLMSPDMHNLICTLLAWQQLGHRSTDSLFNFVQQSLKEEKCRSHTQNEESLCTSSSYESDYASSHVPSSLNDRETPGSSAPRQWGTPAKMDFSTSIGLVVKLPAEPQTLMHVCNNVRAPMPSAPDAIKSPSDSTCKANAASAMQKTCMQQLMATEIETQAQRERVAQLARREKLRTEKLESAERAWHDLEAGYQRRLRLIKEKVTDHEQKIERALKERNKFKDMCTSLVDKLKRANDLLKKEQAALNGLEKEICGTACCRAGLAERAARVDAELTDNQCKLAQLERDLALKEEQERRKNHALTTSVEAAQILIHEVTHAHRNELEMQRQQVASVSKELLDEDARTELLQKRVDEYMKDKNERMKTMAACQVEYEDRMAKLTEELKCKKEQLEELENVVLECLCKNPVDRVVEVKRTPSLAAMCRCSPSNTDSCSCTSIRTRLLAALLSDLFGGLKSEMEIIGSQMPCHLLKCLEDKHNWDRSSDVKQNVRFYFSKLLLGELDIAIATVIENCHGQWVSECCADYKKPQLLQDSTQSIRWKERELELKTQKLAEQMAEKMFKEKAKELALQAQEELFKEGRPPCGCDLKSAVYHCMVPPYQDRQLAKIKDEPLTAAKPKDTPRSPLKQARVLKKTVNGSVTALLNTVRITNKTRKKDVDNIQPETLRNNCNIYRNAGKRRISNATAKNPKTVKPTLKSTTNKDGINDLNKLFTGTRQYAVNMCLCNNNKDLPAYKSSKNFNIESQLSHNYKSCDLCLKQPKDIVQNVPKQRNFRETNITGFSLCTEKCTCLHKIPSNTSVDRLVSILTKWRDDLGEPQDCNMKEALNTDSLFKITHASIVNVIQELCEQTKKTESENSIEIIEQSVTRISNKINTISNESEKTLDNDDKFSKTILSSQLQIKQSKMLMPINLNDNVQNVKLYTNNMLHHLPTAKSHVKEDRSNTFNIDYTENDNNIQKKNAEINIEGDIPVKDIIQRSEIQVKQSEKCIQCLGATLATAIGKQTYESQISQKTQHHELENNNISSLGNEQRKNYHCSTFNNQHSINQINQVAKLPSVQTNNYCDSYIQFLGVALENATALSPRKTKKPKLLSNRKKYHRNHLTDDKRNNSSDSKTVTKIFQLAANRNVRKPRCAIKRIKALNVVHVHNECVHSHKNADNNMSTEDQNISSNNILRHEPCVCCPVPKEKISDDLEVNAFQLLEEHLKTKLDELRHSTCIQNVNKESILGDTLNKVKKLILESANTVTCKCAGNNKTYDGSWKRAYGLLQEYLKTKIEHVKCLCSSVEYSQDCENLVSRVLSQINCLIENDLQRLKNICDCNDTTLDVKQYDSHNSHELQYIIGESRTYNNMMMPNTIDQKCMLMSQTVKSTFVDCTNDVIMPQNKSAQVLLPQSVETKSCDALKTYNQYSEVQTVDFIRTKIVIDNYINTETEYNNTTLNNRESIESINKTQNMSNPHPEIQNSDFSKDTTAYQLRNITVLPKTMSLTHKIDQNDSNNNSSYIDNEESEDKIEKPFMSYIGCTINCCCDRDLGCVCTKSTLPSKTEWLKADVLWKKITQRQGLLKNVSYILNSIPKPVPKTIDSVLDVTRDRTVIDVIPLHKLDQGKSDILVCPNVKQNISPDPYTFNVNIEDNNYKEELVDISKTILCESEVNASEENQIYLKKSMQRLDINYDTANTLTDDSLLGVVMLPDTKHQCMCKEKIHGLLKNTPRSVSNSDTTLVTSRAPQPDCDCAWVPICHVKMLMESIGSKLINAECTCDSLKSVCPVHS